MKKLFFLTALLCASVMAFATAPVTGSSTEKSDGNDFVNGYDYSFSTEGTTVTISFTEKENFVGLVAYLWDYTNGFKETPMSVSEHTASISLTNQAAGTVLTFACKFAFAASETFPNGMCVTKQFTYTVPSPDKSDPKISLNETAVTLDAATPETFQIVPSRLGDGAISYLSNNTSVATVSDDGLVTAVNRGTTTITVSVAGTDSYYASSTTLTVTVTGVNWDALAWLGDGAGGGTYAEKYKLAPADGQGVVNIQNREVDKIVHAGIYTTYAGAFTSCSLGEGNYDTQGAGMWLFLSAFTKKYTDVIVTTDAAGGTTYNFTVYYVDGDDTTTAITNTEVEAKAVKVIENGQLIIIKNGVKYNALGAELR